MKKVTVLYRFDSRWNIVDRYTFEKNNYRVSESGVLYLDAKNISNCKPDAKKNIEVRLIDDNGKQVRFKLHQVVGQTFFPEGIKDGWSVDHINRLDRLNNSTSNLRWLDRNGQFENRENREYKIKKVLCLNNSQTYDSCKEAELVLGLIKNTVSRVARGERASIHNYRFSFVN